jgi:hypothetical protein
MYWKVLNMEMNLWELAIHLNILWCGSFRGCYFCATERILIRKANFTPNSYSFSQNAPFGEGNTFPRPILLKLKIGQVFLKASL